MTKRRRRSRPPSLLLAVLLSAVRAGAAVPVKFSLGGDRGMAIFAPGSPSVALIACGTDPSDALESTAPAGANALSYDAAIDRYTYVWKTQKAWSNSCRELVLTFRDGTVERARFQFTK